MSCKISVLTWEGSDSDVMNEMIRILKTIDSFSGYEFDIQAHRIGRYDSAGAEGPVHPEALAACRASQAVFLGPVHGVPPCDRAAAAALQQLCNAVGAAAHIRGIAHRVSPEQKSNGAGLDVLIVQEIGRQDSSAPGGSECQAGARTFCAQQNRAMQALDLAFQKARRRRRKISLLEQSAMPGLIPAWQQGLDRIQEHYPEVQVESLDWKSWTSRLVFNPGDFDVIVTDPHSSHVVEIGFAAIAGADGIFSFASVGRSAVVYETGCNSPLGALNWPVYPWTFFSALALFLRHTAGLHQEADDLESAMHTVVIEARHSQRKGSGMLNCDTGSASIGALVQQTFTNLLDQHYPYHAV